MGENIDVTRRDALKATGSLVGGFAVGGATVGSAAAQETYYRYEAMQVRLVDVDARPPRFHTVERALYLAEPLLADCNTEHPCSIDVLDYDASDDDDDTVTDDDGGSDDDGDDGSDNDGDDDRGCAGFASVVLLCHGESSSDAVVLAGLMADVLSEYAERGFDFVVGLSPSDATSVDDPEALSTPCPATDDDTGDDGDDGTTADTGNDDADDDADDNSDNGDDGADDN